jgi:crotonobetainyl-CoA:carnitine CoA-transferase CaiB-like acyl-CoA transferase
LVTHSPDFLRLREPLTLNPESKIMNRTLQGLIVADFSRILAGPYATMLLADLGATVIKVEKPGSGDDTRSWLPPTTPDGRSTYFESVNRNKKSLTLDLTQELDQKRAINLAQRADILVENHKAGSLHKYGLDYSSLAATNPKLIYCSISGFGSGAGGHLPGYDLLVQAMGGLMSITGDAEPTKVGVALVDVITGLHAAVGILAALHQREATGLGQHIEVNLLSSLLSSMVNQSSAYVLGGSIPQRMGNAHPSIAPYEVFSTADQSIVIAVGNDSQFRQLCSTLGIDSAPADEKFATNAARVENRALLKEVIENRLRTRQATEWTTLLTDAGIPCGQINSIDQAFALAESLGLTPIVNNQVANPLTFSASPVDIYEPAPLLGESNQEVIELLSLDDD